MSSRFTSRTCPLCNGSGSIDPHPVDANAQTLFDRTVEEERAPRPAPVHANARDTERAAALRIAPKAGTLRALALAAFQHDADAGGTGLTDAELAALTGKYLYSMAPRRTELEKGGWVEDSKLRRDTPNGSPAIVWRLSQAGRARLAGVKT